MQSVIYFEAKKQLNSLLNQAIAEGISQEETIYCIMKAADDSFKLKHAAKLHEERDEAPED